METITLTVSGSPDISFTGQLVAQERDPKKAIITAVYETPKGNWLLALTNDRGILFKHKIIESKSKDELIAALGFDAVAKAIYEQLDIDTTQKIDI